MVEVTWGRLGSVVAVALGLVGSVQADPSCPGGVPRLDLASGSAAVGVTVTLAVDLTSNGAPVGATANDLSYDPQLLSFARVQAGARTTERNGTCHGREVRAGLARVGCLTSDGDHVAIPYADGRVALLTFSVERCPESGRIVIANRASGATVPPAIGPVEGMCGRDGMITCVVTTTTTTSSTIAAPQCGDSKVTADEQCDDGNTADGDCCSSACQFESGSCDDGNACTTDDTCGGGTCIGGPPLSCDDGIRCTDDTCDPASGCLNSQNTACPVQLVRAKKLTVKIKPKKPKKNRLIFLSKGEQIDLSSAAARPPTKWGATLRVSDGGGQEVVFNLPALSWKGLGRKAPGAKGFRYKDKKGEHGPCRKVMFKSKQIKAACKGEGVRLALPLSEPVEVVLQMGMPQTGMSAYCAAFGGKVTRNEAGSFVAKGSQAPLTCAAVLLAP